MTRTGKKDQLRTFLALAYFMPDWKTIFNFLCSMIEEAVTQNVSGQKPGIPFDQELHKNTGENDLTPGACVLVKNGMEYYTAIITDKLAPPNAGAEGGVHEETKYLGIWYHLPEQGSRYSKPSGEGEKMEIEGCMIIRELLQGYSEERITSRGRSKIVFPEVLEFRQHLSSESLKVRSYWFFATFRGAGLNVGPMLLAGTWGVALPCPV